MKKKHKPIITNDQIRLAVRLWKAVNTEKRLRTEMDDPDRPGYDYETGDGCRINIIEPITHYYEI